MSTVDNVSFTLTIETGNQAVVVNAEMVVAHMLVMVATQIRDGKREGLIRDDNGARVGAYCLTTGESADDDDNG